MFHFLLLPFHLIPVFFPLLLPYREAGRVVTGNREGYIGASCRCGIERDMEPGGSTGRGGISVRCRDGGQSSTPTRAEGWRIRSAGRDGAEGTEVGRTKAVVKLKNAIYIVCHLLSHKSYFVFN